MAAVRFLHAGMRQWIDEHQLALFPATKNVAISAGGDHGRAKFFAVGNDRQPWRSCRDRGLDVRCVDRMRQGDTPSAALLSCHDCMTRFAVAERESERMAHA